MKWIICIIHLDLEQKKYRVEDISPCRTELTGVSNQGKNCISAAVESAPLTGPAETTDP